MNPTWDQNGMTCDSLDDFTAMLPTLEVGENDNQKFVNINRFDGQNNEDYVYLSSGPSGAGFYVATFDEATGRFISTGTLYSPNDQEQLWASVGGSIYIEYNGSSWVEKEVVGFDRQTWTRSSEPMTSPIPCR